MRSKLMFRIVLRLFFISFLIFPLTVSADENADNQKAVALDDITVRAGKPRNVEERISAELGEFGHPTFVVTREQIRESGFVDLAKIVEAMVPGIFSSSRQGRGGWTYTSLHGSDEILWLLDGVRITNPLYGSDWSTTLSVHLIDRIEVLKGGESLFYGTGARAGVINIITKPVTDETSGEFGASYGDYDYREVYGNVSGSINDHHGFMVFGSYEGWDGYQVCNDQSYRDAQYTDKKHDVGFDRTTVGGKYRKKMNLAGKAELEAQLQKQQGYYDYPYPMYRTAFNDWEEEIGILKWNHDITQNFSYYIKSYFHRWDGEVTFIDPDGSYSWGSDYSNQTPWGYEDYGVNLITSTRWGEGHEILAGIDYQNYWGWEEVMDVDRTERTQSYGYFANYRPYLFFLPKTKMAMGGRYTRTNEGVDSTIWDVSMKTPIAGPFYARGKVGTTFSLPSLMELYGDQPAFGTYGNPDLDPEESMNVEVGFGGDWRYFRFEAGYYYQEIEDMITTVTLDNGDVSYKNIDGKNDIYSYEILAGIGPFRGFNLNLSATWVDAEDKESGEQLSRIPEFYCQANLGYRNTTGSFGADLMTRYVEDIYQRNLAPFDDVNYGDYFIADASAFVRFGQDLKHKLTLRLENIFDEEYAARVNRARNPEREFFLYNQDGLPRNLMLGYTYTF